jgi:hypothetical protein
VDGFTHVRVFTASSIADRAELPKRITGWLTLHPDADVLEKVVTQSSSGSFHCLTVVLFYRLRVAVESG